MDPASIIMQLVPWVAGVIVITSGLGIYASHAKTRMKIQNGYPLEGMWGQSLKPTGASEHAERIKLLTQENAALRAEVSSVKERLGVKVVIAELLEEFVIERRPVQVNCRCRRTAVAKAHLK